MSSPQPIFLRNSILFDGRDVRVGMSVLVRNGLVEAVGRDADVIRRAREVGAREIDAREIGGGRAFVMPGIVDSHIHVASLGESLENVSLFDSGSAEECAALVAERAAATERGRWIVARGWRKSSWPSDEFPTAAILDGAVPQNPVFCRSFDGHSAWVNSLGMRTAGVTESTEDPAGGEVVRDPSGVPTGVFKENAIGLIRRMIPEPGREERRRSFRLAQEHLNRLGVSGVHEMSGFGDYEIAVELANGGELTLRYGGTCAPGEIEEGARAAQGSEARSLVRMLGVKMFVDGSLNSQTAAMFEAYGGGDNRGIITLEYEDLKERVAKANRAGLAVLVHAIGDRGVSSVLDAIEEVGDTSPRRPDDQRSRPTGLSNRIEHAAVLREADIDRMVALGVHASCQPCHIVTDIAPCERYLGDRCKRAYVYREMADKGLVMAFGSDAPVVSADPRVSLFAAVARTDLEGRPPGGWYPEQRLTIGEALRCFCVGPAASTGAARSQGKLAPGFSGDLTIFAENPFDCAPQELLTLTTLMTVVEGRIVYEKP